MNNHFSSIFILAILLISSSCANYKVNYSADAKKWTQVQQPDASQLRHSLYLIGDAGNAPVGSSTPVLKYLKQHLPSTSPQSTVLFLGDNISPDGLPPKSDEEQRKLAEHRIQVQLDILKDFKGSSIFIPGNQDWQYGLKGLRRQEKFVEKHLNRMRGIEDDDAEEWQDYFYPNGGCPGPEIIEVNDQLVIIAIDSQWWLTDWDKEPEIHDGCEVKNRFQFKFLFENALRKYKSKNVVVAMHHPLYTNGPHGGKYTAKEHLFPLTQFEDNLYLPLPGLGTATAFLRGVTGTRQDMSHPLYKELRRTLLFGAKKNGNFIFVSGHEHNLQYLQNEEQHFIVSGAASSISPSSLGKGAEFAYGGRGYAVLKFYKDGSTWLHTYKVSDDGEEASLLFRKKIKGELPISEKYIPDQFPEYESLGDSIELAVIQNEIQQMGKFGKWLRGEHYRDIYLQQYKVPTLDMATFRGGLTPVKRGGGNQTNSLRTVDAAGKQIVLRDLTKDVSRLLPFPFNKMTIAKGVALDNFLSTHPFAPFALPYLADAIGIYHTNPQLYYIPKQPALGVHNDNFGGSVYLVEERPHGNWEGTGKFGDAKKIIGTPDLAERLLRSNKHRVDQAFTVRTRLFDIVIGDWDRHDDQWRWARFEEEDGKKYYRPIPRDRDQAFSKYDGVMTGLARLTMPFLHQLRAYQPQIPNIKWVTWSARNFDNSFLNEASWEVWEKEVKAIQQGLTDEAIDQAFTYWPPTVQALSADKIKSTLRARRDKLMDTARRYYEFLAAEVDVYGSEKPELFLVERISDSFVKVSIYELNKQGERKEKSYERLFECQVTKAIDIYGVGDDDRFEVSGEVNESILVRLIGGQGEDHFIDQSKVQGNKKMTHIYDDLRKNTVEKGTEAKDKRTKQRIYNIYDRKAYHYEYDFLMPFPIIGGNPDDGLTLGASMLWTDYKFKKAPYNATHHLIGSFAFSTKSYYLDYTADFLEAVGHWDFYLEALAKGPSYTFNYFGFGNDTKADFETFDIEFYRARQSQIRLYPALKKRFAGNGGFVALGPVFEWNKLEQTNERFISSPEAELSASDFDNKYFGGAELTFGYFNLDNIVIPHRGISLNAKLNWLNDLNEKDYNFGMLRADFSLYQSLDRRERLIFATRFGLGHNLGNAFEFYHAPSLGGRESLRGYRTERFYGKTAFWQNIDLRAQLFSSYNQAIPFTFGLFAGFDHGRVWEDDDNSDQWHYNYGGGIWIAPVDVLTLTIGVFQPRESNEDGPRLAFRLGMGF